MGKIASEAWDKGSGKADPREIQRASEKEYIEELSWCVNHAKKQIDCSSVKGHEVCKDAAAFEGSFFIEALVKKEKLLENVLRNYFIPRSTCPTPFYDQTVYRYNHINETVEFLWVVPDKETCETFKENRDLIVPSELGLLKFVLDFDDGTLFRMAKKFNGETMNHGIILEGR